VTDGVHETEDGTDNDHPQVSVMRIRFVRITYPLLSVHAFRWPIFQGFHVDRPLVDFNELFELL